MIPPDVLNIDSRDDDDGVDDDDVVEACMSGK